MQFFHKKHCVYWLGGQRPLICGLRILLPAASRLRRCQMQDVVPTFLGGGAERGDDAGI
uniref:Uncharacterized protein n=1 Tax=Arundo donax TaxID=35708 RepID=A0A0A9HQ95_ARUDO